MEIIEEKIKVLERNLKRELREEKKVVKVESKSDKKRKRR